MIDLDPSLRRRLDWLSMRHRLWQLAGEAALLMALLLVGVGVVVHQWRGGQVDGARAAVALLVWLMAVGCALLGVALWRVLRPLDRPQLASMFERANPALMDRMHTVVAAAGDSDERRVAAPREYVRRIQEQITGDPFLAEPALRPLKRRAAGGAALLLVAFCALIWLLDRPRPAGAGSVAGGGGPGVGESEAVALGAPAPMLSETQDEALVAAAEPWGEVRIVEPGRDLRVTKVDVVPLRIEVATERPIGQSAYLTSKTGEAPVTNDLGPPSEPRYATFRPHLYVDEFELEDWDVLAYHAATATRDGEEFASEIYFLEIRPFREEILRAEEGMGEGGRGDLNEISGLIDEQKRAMREIHRFTARSYVDPELQEQDRGKLAAGETEIATAVRHLYAKLAAEENRQIGAMLDHLALAEEWLLRTASELEGDGSTPAASAQRALAELVAARKDLQKRLGAGQGEGGDPADAVAEPLPEDVLEQIAEYRDAAAAAERSLEEIARTVERVEREATASDESEYPQLADEQQEAVDALDRLRREHPSLDARFEGEIEAAAEALEAAQRSLREERPEALGDQRGARQAIEELRNRVAGAATQEQLTDAYRLKRLLDEQIETLKQAESRPGAMDGAAAERTAEAASRTVDALREALDEPAARRELGPQARDALSGADGDRLDAALDRLREASGGERDAAVTAARRELERVADAFDAGAPEMARELRQRDALRPPAADALGEALDRLRSLLERPPGSAEEEALRGEAEALVAEALDSNTSGGVADDLVVRLGQALAEENLDREGLRLLLQEIVLGRVEGATAELAEEEIGELTDVDLSQLPASYRRRIERYLRELSERD